MVSDPPDRFSSSSPNHLNITVFVWCCGGTNVATVNSSAAADCAEKPTTDASAKIKLKRVDAIISS